MIKGIIIDVGGDVKELTLEQAQKLYKELGQMFEKENELSEVLKDFEERYRGKDKEYVPYPYPYPYPVYPNYPSRNPWEIRYLADTGTTDAAP